jgi:hypothetical protein
MAEQARAGDGFQLTLRFSLQLRLTRGVDMTSDVKSEPPIILHFLHL